MKALLITASIVLAGCTTMDSQELAQASDWDVCKQIVGAGPRTWGVREGSANAQAEANRRSLDCRPMIPAILAQEEARQNRALMWNALTRPVPPRTTTCHAFGNTLTCN